MNKLFRFFVAGAIGAAALTAAPAFAASTIYVDDNCSPPANGTSTDPYCTIQEAVNAAVSGDTIQVAAGVYNESVTVNKSLKIRGIQYGDSATNGWLPAGVESVVDPPSGPAFNITASSVTIDGFRITGATDNYGIVTSASASGYQILNNFITNNPGGGINLNSNGTIQTVLLRNVFTANGADAIRSTSGLNNAFIDHNNFSGHTNSAITLSDAATHSNVRFSYNVSTNDVAGINLYRTTNSEFDHNTITGSGAGTDWGGISLGGANTYLSIHHNTVQNRNFHGIVVTNYIAGANTNLTIDHNDSNNNTLDGIRIDAGSTGNLIIYNDMAGNAEHDAHDSSVGVGTAGTGNTWDNNDCVTDLPDGLCD